MKKRIMLNEKYSVDQVQEKLMILLVEFDRICRLHNIKYVLDGGTLLGAARHNGFIPWDDDIDVAMLRRDYKKFIKYCKSDLNKELFTLDSMQTTPYESYFNFGKLRLKNTIWEERGSENIKTIKGIYLDIFPLDNSFKFCYKFQSKMSAFWQYLRWLKLGRTPAMYKENKFRSFMAKIIPLRMLTFNAEFSMRFCNIFPTKLVCKIANYGSGKNPHSRKYYENIIEHKFEDKMFFVPKDYENWLNLRYGNWKELPPENEQHPSHALTDIIRIEL